MPTRIDNKGFVVNGKRFFPLGFNYWPRDYAVYFWENYDSYGVQEEMKTISNLGANCIRMFIRWEDLNPEKNKIRNDVIKNFEDFLKKAEGKGIKVIPTLLIGHMSGQNWFPDWFYILDSPNSNTFFQAIDKPPYGNEKCKCRDIYLDPIVLENSKKQIKAILSYFCDNDTIISWDISNENQYWMKPASPVIAMNYLKEISTYMQKIDPNHPITYGMGKFDEISGFISFGKTSFSKYVDYYSVHVYPEFLYPMTNKIIDFYTSYRISYELDLSKLSNKIVQLQEFGLSDDFFPLIEENIKNQLLYGYYNTSLWSCVANQIRGGALSWDFCDFSSNLKDENPYDHKPFELKFGVVDENYQIKPSGKAFKRFSRFINETNTSKFTQKLSKVAIVLPDNFNDYPEVQHKRSILEENNLNHQKTLFSSYIWCKMNHINVEFISLYDSECDLARFNLLIFPNIYSLSKKTIKKCLNFLKTQKNKIAYFSSNSFLPEKIFGDVSWGIINNKKKILQTKVIKSRYGNLFCEDFEFKKVKNQIKIEEEIDKIHPILVEKNSASNILMILKEFPNNNKAFFLAIAPEINHTFVRNSYRNDSGPKLYRKLLNLSNIDRDLKCDNPHIQSSILYNKNQDQTLLVCINHEFSSQLCKVELKDNWKNIYEFYDQKYNLRRSKTLEFELDPFGSYTFILEK